YCNGDTDCLNCCKCCCNGDTPIPPFLQPGPGNCQNSG
ncbi:unnamed protein product, partial [Adineta steineri]